MIDTNTRVAQLPMPGAGLLSLHLLGVPSISFGGRVASINRTQTRALLFRLGVRLEPVAREELATLFWPETDDATARQNLRRLLSFVRSDLPDPEALIATHMAIALNPERVWSDAHLLEQLKHTDDVASWQATADLYNGAFLSGFFLRNNAEFELWQSRMTERLRTRCLEALARLIDHCVGSGDYHQAVRYARRYLEIDNLAETIHRQLISLYARLGERQQALHQFEECAAILHRELGVEPLPETRLAWSLARQNRSAPATAAPPAVCHVLPSLDAPLIGRDVEMRQLGAAYSRHARGGFLLLSGETGIGKSRLLGTFIAHQNALVLTGYCHAGSELLPCHPLVEALRQAMTSPYFACGVAPVWLVEAEQLLPELRSLFPELAAQIAAHGERTQARLFEAIVQILLGLAAREQVILCLEDAHWADEATLAWLRYALTRLRAARVCIIATSTEGDAGALAALLRSLEREGQAAEIKLGSLGKPSVLAILQAVKRPQPQDEETARQIWDAAGGNTFFVLELVRELAQSDHLDAPPDPLPVPETVHKMIERRLARLSAVSRQVLEAAAVLNPELDYEVLRATTGRDEQEVNEALEQLIDHQLLRQSETGLQFQHSIVQTAVFAEVKLWRRRMLHHRAADALVRLGVRRSNHLHAAVASHYAAAGNEQRALHFYYEASVAAQTHLSARMAVQYAERGLALIGSATAPQSIANLLEALGDGLGLLGQLDAAHQAYSSALARLGQVQTPQTAGLDAKCAGIRVLQGRYVDAAAPLQAAFEKLEHLADQKTAEWWRVWLDARLAQANICWLQPDRSALQALLKDLAPQVSKFGVLRQKNALAELVYYSELRSGGPRCQESTVERQRQDLLTASQCGFPREIVVARIEYGFSLLWSKHFAEARSVLAAAFDDAGALDMAVLQLKAATHLLILYRFQGEAELSEPLCHKALELAQAVNSPIYLGFTKAEHAWLLLRGGNLAAAQAAASSALAAWGRQRFPLRWLALWVLLAVQTRQDEIDEAVQTAWRILDESQQTPVAEVASVLTLAVECWTAGDAAGAGAKLWSAIELGYTHHYL